jgi:YggT family protein
VSSLISAVQLISLVLTLAVLADVIVSFFLNPFHPIRRWLDSVVEPMLAPIRRILPAVGPLDFSPFVLLILIQLVQDLLVRVLQSLR